MRSEAPMNSRLAVTLLFGLVPAVACTAAAQTARVGAHYGVNLSDGHWEDERLGGQASVHIVGPLDTAGSDFTDAIVLGLEAPTPHVRPFADLYLIDILDRESAVGVNLLMGIQF